MGIQQNVISSKVGLPAKNCHITYPLALSFKENVMKRTIKKIFGGFATLLAACGISVYFTACYGMPPYYLDYIEDEETTEEPADEGDSDSEETAKNISQNFISE